MGCGAFRKAKSVARGGRVESNFLDIGFGIVLVLFLVRGLLRGMVQELAGLIGLFAGFFLAGRFYMQLAPHLNSLVGDRDWAAGLAYGLIFLGTLVAVAICAALLRKFMSFTFTSWLDHLLGGVVGGGKGVLLCAIALAVMNRFVPDSPFLKNSLLAPHIDAITVFARSLVPAFL